jgi:uncharacterized membrane protein YidH (DUF202 family)
MANERTFLKWLRTAIFIGVIGVTILVLNLNPYAGIVFMFGAFALMFRALYIYYFRVNQIRYLGGGSFVDLYSPIIVVLIIICGLVTIACGRGSASGITIATVG